MKKSDKKRSFKKGTVLRNSIKQRQGSQFAHLSLPKGINMFKEDPKSRVDLDILPYEVTTEFHPDRDDEYGIAVPGGLWYKRPYWLHRNFGTNNSETILCPTSVKQKCPICEYRNQLLKDGAKWDDDSVKTLKPSLRNLYVVIPKNNKNYEEKPHIWDMSDFLFQAKLDEEIKENEEHETFPDLEEGFTLRIRFSESALGTNKFAETSRIDFVERPKPYSESILAKIPSLDDILVVKPYKVISAQFFGNLPSSEETEEDDEQSTNISSNDADDDEENESNLDDSNDDDDEEEEEKPSAKTRTKKSQDKKEEKHIKKDKKEDKPISKDKKEEKPTKNSKKSCPHGHEFGKEIDEHKECTDCKVWDDCMDASDA